MDKPIFLWILSFIIIKQSTAFPEGAPIAACHSRYPQHGGAQPRQDDPSPYRILVDQSSYDQRDILTVSIESTSPTQRPIKGLLLVAHRTTPGIDEALIGKFRRLTPNDQLQYISCDGRSQSAVTHENSQGINSSIRIEWEAPDHNAGPVVFEATVVESYDVFYVNLESPVINPSVTNLPTPPPTPRSSIVRPLTTPIDWDACGEDKGCLLYPSYCTEDCVVAVSFEFLDKMTRVRFELTAKSGTYVSLGLSDDKTMGNDQTITCTDYFGRAGIQFGYNHPDRYNVRQLAVNMSDLEVKIEDGQLSCRFTSPVVMENKMAIEDQPGSTLETNLAEQELYLFLAWGNTYLSTDTISQHVETPVVSNDKLSLKDVDVFRGSCLPHLSKVHACLMCLAWMGFAPLAIFTARYYKQGFKYTVVFDTKLWLVIHSASSLLTATLTLGGLVAILVELEGKVTKNSAAFTHTCLGFTVIALLCLQGLASLYVPGPSSRKRPLFNFFHRLIGSMVFMMAAITVFDAYAMEVFSSEMRMFCKTSMLVWAGAFVALLFCLEGYQYLMTKYMIRKIRSDQYDLDKISVRSLRLTQEEKPEPSHILYGVVIGFFLCSVAAALCMTILF